MPSVRTEMPHDAAAIRDVLERAFDPSPAEARLVDLLRAAGELEHELCLVAVDGEQVVGYVAFSRATVDSGDEVLALAPMAVVPERQSQRIGETLVREALHRAQATRFPLVVVLGTRVLPAVRLRAGGDLGIVAPFEVPPEAWMALRLQSYRRGPRRPDLRGRVRRGHRADEPAAAQVVERVLERGEVARQEQVERAAVRTAGAQPAPQHRAGRCPR